MPSATTAATAAAAAHATATAPTAALIAEVDVPVVSQPVDTQRTAPQPPLPTAAQYHPHPRRLPGGGGVPRDEPVVVIIRHGKTEYNKLGIFTGWDDVALANEGRNEAMAAGKLLKLHGITFDVVYTSWLSRAIETAWLVVRISSVVRVLVTCCSCHCSS
jgi:hypothetical protein